MKLKEHEAIIYFSSNKPNTLVLSYENYYSYFKDRKVVLVKHPNKNKTIRLRLVPSKWPDNRYLYAIKSNKEGKLE
jgi:hypothetical protein